MINCVEVFRYVTFYYSTAFSEACIYHFDRGMTTSSGSETVRCLLELGFKDGAQYHSDHLLYNPVIGGRDS